MVGSKHLVYTGMFFALSMGIFTAPGCIPPAPQIACRPCPCDVSLGYTCVDALDVCVRNEDLAAARQDISSFCSGVKPIAEEPRSEAKAPDSHEGASDSQEPPAPRSEPGPEPQSEPATEPQEEPSSPDEPQSETTQEPDAAGPDAQEPLVQDLGEPTPELPPEPTCPQPPICPNQEGVCLGSKPVTATCTNGQWVCTAQDYTAHSPDYRQTDTSCDVKDNNCDGRTDEGGKNCISTVLGAPLMRHGHRLTATFQNPHAIVYNAAKDEWFVADTINRVIRKIDSAGQVTVFTGTGEKGGLNGDKNTAQLYFPHAMAIDAAGNIYVADLILPFIRKIDTNGHITTIAGGTTHGYKDDVGMAALFNRPTGIAVTPDGKTLYIADNASHTIRMIEVSTQRVTTLAGANGQAGYVDATGGNARFHSPRGLFLSSAGNLYVADTSNHLIRMITPAGVVTTFAGKYVLKNGIPEAGHTDDKRLMARLTLPYHVVQDNQKRWFINDTYGGIRMIDTTDNLTTLNKNPQLAPPCDFSKAIDNIFYRSPTSLMVTSKHLYVSDALCHKISRIDLNTLKPALFAGFGPPGSKNGKASVSAFDSPRGLTFADPNTMFIADTSNHFIRKATRTSPTQPWTVTTYAGSGSLGQKNGSLTTATFFSLRDLVYHNSKQTVYAVNNGCVRAVSSTGVITLAGKCGDYQYVEGNRSGNRFGDTLRIALNPSGTLLYVADTKHHIIRSVNVINGESKLVAGTVTNGVPQKGKSSLMETDALKTLFDSPTGISFDSMGRLLIADSGNHVIRRLDLTTMKVETLFGPTISTTSTTSGTYTLQFPLVVREQPQTGHIFVLNPQEHRFFSYNLTHKTGLIYGQVGPALKNGPTVDGLFNGVAHFTFDVTGKYLYFTEVNGHRVRRIAFP